MYLKHTMAGLALALSMAAPIALAEKAHDHGAHVYFIAPQHGDTLSSPVKVVFGLSGMGVAPAGVDKPGTGHHHLLVNSQALPNMTQPIPSDEQHRHFGKGQTETMLELAPGTHTLRLVLGDKNHVPVGEHMVSDEITITVE